MAEGFPQFVGIGPYGAENWKGSVATFGDLPSTGNKDGDVRGVLDTERAYQWDETTTAWTLYSGPGLPPGPHKPTHVDGASDGFTDADTINLGTLKTGLTTLRYTKTVQTTNDTPADIDAIPVVEARVVDVEVVVIARKADGTERGVYHLEGVFYRNTGGDVTQQGNTASLLIRRSTSALGVDIVPDTGNQTVDVRVTGLAATTVKWEARVILTNLVGA